MKKLKKYFINIIINMKTLPKIKLRKLGDFDKDFFKNVSIKVHEKLVGERLIINFKSNVK